jgi:hypothetical protein
MQRRLKRLLKYRKKGWKICTVHTVEEVDAWGEPLIPIRALLASSVEDDRMEYQTSPSFSMKIVLDGLKKDPSSRKPGGNGVRLVANDLGAFTATFSSTYEGYADMFAASRNVGLYTLLFGDVSPKALAPSSMVKKTKDDTYAALLLPSTLSPPVAFRSLMIDDSDTDKMQVEVSFGATSESLARTTESQKILQLFPDCHVSRALPAPRHGTTTE